MLATHTYATDYQGVVFEDPRFNAANPLADFYKFGIRKCPRAKGVINVNTTPAVTYNYDNWTYGAYGRIFSYFTDLGDHINIYNFTDASLANFKIKSPTNAFVFGDSSVILNSSKVGGADYANKYLSQKMLAGGAANAWADYEHNSAGAMAFRHLRRANLGYMDGHCGTMSYQELASGLHYYNFWSNPGPVYNSVDYPLTAPNSSAQ